MNYHHAFHAGNHAEVFKHSALVKLLLRMKQKSTPLFFLDTHAGAGLTNLHGEQAARTGEARSGILKVVAKSCPVASRYIEIVRSFNKSEIIRYPGSALIARTLLSNADHLVACELRDTAYHELKRLFRGDRAVSVHHRDGYEAMKAFVPPPEGRGVVFLDPPYEDRGETARLARDVVASVRKWPNGVFAIWYPIKDRFAGRPIIESLLSIGAAKVLSAEFIPFPVGTPHLAGGGLIFCNTPWLLDQDIRDLCAELLVALEAPAGRWNVKWATA
jgi:23S rRNA (adenine2030-N6)-methyltransferase